MTQQDSESKPKKRQVWVQWMDGRTHDTFATTGVDLVTLTDDAEVLTDVAETAHTLYNEKQPEGQNLPAHVLQSQLYMRMKMPISQTKINWTYWRISESTVNPRRNRWSWKYQTTAPRCHWSSTICLEISTC
ncbi:hypothetical protein JG688_00007631 [Phytophthora aleatoria]|uniref:Uncharacterized protein n=1 Tax=Phytophthora aleatoria TaxID=2496075 RepID=A0A8J5IY51_9STRA|nr:hypothetical protein JG688_00007631 [Phytophthora aleatoria]